MSESIFTFIHDNVFKNTAPLGDLLSELAGRIKEANTLLEQLASDQEYSSWYSDKINSFRELIKETVALYSQGKDIFDKSSEEKTSYMLSSEEMDVIYDLDKCVTRVFTSEMMSRLRDEFNTHVYERPKREKAVLKKKASEVKMQESILPRNEKYVKRVREKVDGILSVPPKLQLEEARAKAISFELQKLFRNKIEAQLLEGEDDYEELKSICPCDEFVNLVTEYRQKSSVKENRIAGKSPFSFVTINPRSDVSFESLRKRVEKYVQSKMVGWYKLAYEIRSHLNERPSGFHVHILIHRYEVKPSDFKRRTVATFLPLCGSEACIDIRPVALGSQSGVLKYLSGIKTDWNGDGHKQRSFEATIAWRRSIGLPDLISSDGDTNIEWSPVSLIKE